MTGVWEEGRESWLSVAETGEHGFERVLFVENVGVGGGFSLCVYQVHVCFFQCVYVLYSPYRRTSL